MEKSGLRASGSRKPRAKGSFGGFESRSVGRQGVVPAAPWGQDQTHRGESFAPRGSARMPLRRRARGGCQDVSQGSKYTNVITSNRYFIIFFLKKSNSLAYIANNP